MTFGNLKWHLASVLLLLQAACGGGGGDSSAPPPPPVVAGTAAVVSGKLVAPDNKTPIANALVYVEGATARLGVTTRERAQAATATCGAPPNLAWAATCTGADGSFSLDVVLPAAPKLVALKGAFRLETLLGAPSGGTLALGTVALSATTTGARLAVVTGSFDRIEDVLAKLGYGEIEAGALKLGTEKFALFNGNGSLPASYKPMAALFADADGNGKADIYNFGVVFFNCGLDETALSDPANRAILRAYVESGGRVYASDLAYDFVEQVFPEFIDFEGSDGVAATAPETQDAAQLGESGITTEASVDPALSAWLGGVTCGAPAAACLNTNGTVHIEGFLSGWSVAKGPHPAQQAQVRTWVSGPITFFGQASAVVRPLTMSFPAGLGRVTYTSYHNEPGLGATGFVPQERILQFIVFEL